MTILTHSTFSPKLLISVDTYVIHVFYLTKQVISLEARKLLGGDFVVNILVTIRGCLT